MEIEFHYYITYLISTRAGFSPQEAETLAYSSQYVDENNRIFQIDKGQPTAYDNYITQTLNILKPKSELMRIYPTFHFIPGDPLSTTARRKDGKLHRLNTTPNSENANLIFDAALSSGNLYRIGIAAHSYVDTWAHQNFVGYYDTFNAMKGVLSSALPNIGHADAKHKPDQPALVWTDCRLVASNARVNNRVRFLDAAEHLFRKLRRCVDANCPQPQVSQDVQNLRRDLDQAIGIEDPKNQYRSDRLQRYLALGQQATYGGISLALFNADYWFDQAITHTVRGISDDHTILSKLDPRKDEYTWKDNYLTSHWYKFQEAAKAQQKSAWDILRDRTFDHLELENL
ncbi:MAG: DUF6765 family protein [Cyanobacteria bacterium P01_A01_bin.123]